MDYQLGPGPLQVDQNTIDEKIKGDIGIVENGDVATHTIPNGYYVIWKGDLYVAKTIISSGTTLSAESNGNLTAKPNGLGGEVAALNSNLTDITTLNANFNLTQTIDGNSAIYAFRYAKILFVIGYLRSQSEDIPNHSLIATINGVSLKHQSFDSPNGDSGDPTRVVLMLNGDIRLEKAMKAGIWYSFAFTALLN